MHRAAVRDCQQARALCVVEVAKAEGSYTGYYVKDLLNPMPAPKAKKAKKEIAAE